MNEANDFTRFNPPEKNVSGKWYVRSVEHDLMGMYRFLVFAGPSRPYLATVIDADENTPILCDTLERANEELLYYYTYHGAPELYAPSMKQCDATIIESETMTF